MGFYVAAPIGAVCIIYIRRTLSNGLKSGIVSALGVTTAEALYAVVVIYGLSFFSDFLLTWEKEMKLCGAFFLLAMGAKSLLAAPPKKIKISKKKDLIYDYFSMLFFGIFNPIAILGFVAIFASFGARSLQDPHNSLVMLLGFVTASFSFCLTLIGASLFLKQRFDARDAQLISLFTQVSGVVIVLFAMAILLFIK